MSDSTYVIWDGLFAVKIGKEKDGYPDFPGRLRGNQTGNARELVVIARHRENYESELHKAMRPWRIRSGAGREWFSIEDKPAAGRALIAALRVRQFELTPEWTGGFESMAGIMPRDKRRKLHKTTGHLEAVAQKQSSSIREFDGARQRLKELETPDPDVELEAAYRVTADVLGILHGLYDRRWIRLSVRLRLLPSKDTLLRL